MGAALHERRLLEHDLRNAISRGELRLVYQPEKNIRAGKVVGFEALLRWKHPTRGEVSREEFIPIAEDTGVDAHDFNWLAGSLGDISSREPLRLATAHLTRRRRATITRIGEVLSSTLQIFVGLVQTPAQKIDVSEMIRIACSMGVAVRPKGPNGTHRGRRTVSAPSKAPTAVVTSGRFS
jgi:hypothetical protein